MFYFKLQTRGKQNSCSERLSKAIRKKDCCSERSLSVNLESISFQIKMEDVVRWYKITRNYFENKNFTIFEERKINRYLSCQFKVKQERSSEYVSCRTLINTEKSSQRAKVPDLERLYGIIFQVKRKKLGSEASGSELTNQGETSGYSNVDVREMNVDHNQCSKKNDLILTIKNETGLDSSKILNTVENTCDKNTRNFE